MAKDPAFLFYTSDFLTGTYLMTDEQVGKYIRLLCLQHQQGHLTENHMVSVCKTYDEAIWSKFTKDENGMYFNERMETEIEKRQNFVDSRRLNGAKGGRKPKEQQNHMQSICKPYGKATQNLGEDVNDNENSLVNTRGKRGVGEKGFDQFWSTYPRKANKPDAVKAWKKLNPDDGMLDSILTAIFVQKQSDQWTKEDGKFIPYPSTWLNGHRWEDELPRRQSPADKIMGFVAQYKEEVAHDI
jgi:hypothetical protein